MRMAATSSRRLSLDGCRIRRDFRCIWRWRRWLCDCLCGDPAWRLNALSAVMATGAVVLTALTLRLRLHRRGWYFGGTDAGVRAALLVAGVDHGSVHDCDVFRGVGVVFRGAATWNAGSGLPWVRRGGWRLSTRRWCCSRRCGWCAGDVEGGPPGVSCASRWDSVRECCRMLCCRCWGRGRSRGAICALLPAGGTW